jgi:hypothetical protein
MGSIVPDRYPRPVLEGVYLLALIAALFFMCSTALVWVRRLYRGR